MKVTYIEHSGFAVELPSATLLFDYHKGKFPAFAPDKPLYIFSSHSHGDHFVPEIFTLGGQYPQVYYVLSHDIWMTRKKHTRAGVSEEVFAQADYLRAYETKEYPHLTVTTLRSTDMGVAFLVSCDGHNIYHAGDLHWWAWPGDTKQAANNMTANYHREIETVNNLLSDAGDHSQEGISASDLSSQSQTSLNLAFLPLDGRLEENYAMGINYFLEHIPVTHVFPMHMWGDYSLPQRYLEEHSHMFTALETTPCLHPIQQEGQSWEI